MLVYGAEDQYYGRSSHTGYERSRERTAFILPQTIVKSSAFDIRKCLFTEADCNVYGTDIFDRITDRAFTDEYGGGTASVLVVNGRIRSVFLPYTTVNATVTVLVFNHPGTSAFEERHLTADVCCSCRNNDRTVRSCKTHHRYLQTDQYRLACSCRCVPLPMSST